MARSKSRKALLRRSATSFVLFCTERDSGGIASIGRVVAERENRDTHRQYLCRVFSVARITDG